MSFDKADALGEELGIDLDNPEFSGIMIDRYGFMTIMVPNQHGVIDLNDFGSGFMIPNTNFHSAKPDGIYLKMESDRLLSSLTEAERNSLLEHPFGMPSMPVLAFPFSLRQLKIFLEWAESAGHDFPINGKALGDLIEQQRTSQPALEKNEIAVNQSDASLGAYIRIRNKKFAEKPREERDARSAEKQRWRDKGADIQLGRVKEASYRQLAKLVKQQLNLPDSIETIRRALADVGSG